MRFNLIESSRSLFNARAIKKDPFSIVLLDNPSEKLLSTAVRKDSRVFLLLKNPSENVSRIAISKNPSFIKLIPNPSETLQLLAISKNPTQIVNIKKPTLKTQLKVVTASPECINLIENPSIEAIKLYVGNDYKRFWDLKLSNEKQEKVFNEIFRGKESWNIPTEELITWLSNYTKIKADNIKDIYNTIKDSINVDRMSIKQWQELITTGMCRVGKKEIVLSQKDGVYNVNINQETTENQIEKQSDIKKENVKSEETVKITPEVERISPQQTHLAHGETRPPRRSPELRRYTRRRLQSRPIPPRGARWSPTRRTRRRGRTRLRARSGRARLRARRPAPTRTRARLPRGCRQARFRLLQPCRLLSANDAAADANARATSGFAG